VSNLEFHPLANLFPLMEGEDFEQLADDIAANGLNEDIVLFQGKILDGRNRYRAMLARDNFRDSVVTSYDALLLGSEKKALVWVLSKNLHRRHLSASQRGLLAARLADMKAGRPPKDKETTPIGAVSKKHAAELLNVGQGSVDRGKKVLAEGSEQLVEAVQKGNVSLGAAAEIATLPIDEQVKAIASADPKAFAKVARERRDEKTASKKQRRAEREAELGRHQLSLPDKKFGVILTDDEWEHRPWSDAGLARAAANHYPVSSLDELKKRDIGKLAAKDCVLFMWSTVPHRSQALELMAHRGFKPASECIWYKQYNGARHGMGYWFWINHEILLVGTRGNVPAPAPGTQWPSVIEAPVGAHSKKPEIFHQLIESYFPNLPKIELNARQVRDGWCAWGNEITLEIAEAVNLGVATEGFADASHLPLLPNPGAPSYAPPSAPSESSPVPPPNKKSGKSGQGAKKSKPVSTQITVGDLHLLVRFHEGKAKFYATQKDQLFPAEIGWIQAALPEKVELDAERAPLVAAAVWVGNFSLADKDTWRLPTVVHRMGRTGPVPMKQET